MGSGRIVIWLLLGLSYCVLSCGGYDYLALVQQWPASTCSKPNTKPCNPAAPARFTIESLRHKFNNGNEQINCNGAAYDNSKMNGLVLQEMNLRWPNLYNEKENQMLWKSEWETRGRCDSSNDQTLYFEKALNLQQNNKLLTILQDAGLGPTLSSNPTDLKKIEMIKNAIKNRVKNNVEPGLLCFDSPNGQKQLNQIVMCYRETRPNLLDPIDCPPNINTCDMILWLPSSSSSSSKSNSTTTTSLSSDSDDDAGEFDHRNLNPVVADQ